MTADTQRLRGQPLAVLIALLVGWTGARASTWSWAQELALPETAMAVEPTGAMPRAEPPPDDAPVPQSYPAAPADYEQAPAPRYPGAGRVVEGAGSAERILARLLAMLMRERGVDPDMRYRRPVTLASEFPATRPIAAEDRQDPLASALPGLLPARYYPPAARIGPADRLPGGRHRWSVDAWTLVRGAGGEPSPGVFASSYGASQSGAVVRYRLSMQDPRRPTVYLRTTAALNGPADGDVGLGLSARPLPGIPIEAGVEGRVTLQGGRWRVRPAVLAVTQVPPLALPMSLRAELYGQAGYVAGKYATPFVDGQARVDRSVARVANVEARLGAGVWGGAQKGAARLDAGPGATVSMPLGRGLFGRAAIDWRFRIAGDAEPGSGPALTLATGF